MQTHPFPFRDKMSSNNYPEEQEKEFVGSAGGIGTYRVPTIENLLPKRPPYLEIRPIPNSPRPKDDEKAASVLSVFDLNADLQLWLGLPSQLRVWSFESFWTESCSDGPPPGRGGVWEDEDTAFFSSSAPTPCPLCLVPDTASKIMWSGHVDGKIRAWSASNFESASAFQPVISWQAHKGPVFSLVMTSYGELWSGSESGSLKAWPWEATKRAVALAKKENQSSVLQRSYIDLRSRGTSLGSCSFPNFDIKFLHANHATAKVWSGGFYFLELWDAQSRIILKAFGIGSNCDLSAIDDFSVKDISKEGRNVLLGKDVKNEKTHGPLKHFQQKRCILRDAAEAIRRVGCQEQNLYFEALALSADEAVWSGYNNGTLVKYDDKGRQILEFRNISISIQCLCSYNRRLWVGYSDGRIQVLEQNGKTLGEWIAHSSAIIDIAVGGGFVFTIAADGSIRGWNMMSPTPQDLLLMSALTENEFSYTRKRHLKIFAATWNVGQEQASYDSLVSLLASPASEANIVIIGLQEIEMGVRFLAMAAAKETVGIEGSANGQWWLDKFGEVLDEGTSFERLASRQLAGLLVAAWIRKDLRPYVGELEVGAVACGFGRRIGNKGAVGLKMRIFRRTLCVINCHFAAHIGAVARRNADFEHVYRNMVFSQVTTGACKALLAVQKLKNQNEWFAAELDTNKIENKSTAAKIVPEDFPPELAEVDMLIWLGDFNYRLEGISFEDAKDYIGCKQLTILLEKDQLRREMAAGRVFQGMREAKITFPPTYKFDRGADSCQVYDSSEKKRVPAWCDRILFRDSHQETSTVCNLSCPIVASVTSYDACMNVKDSDHKPVRCMFSVNIAYRNESILRREMKRIMQQHRQTSRHLASPDAGLDTVVSTNRIVLQDSESSVFRIINTSGQHSLVFEIHCGGEAFVGNGQRFESLRSMIRGSFGLPRWLQVVPASGFIDPGGTREIAIFHEDFFTEEEYVDGNSTTEWCEDVRDKCVVLLVNIRRCTSDESGQHQIFLSHDKVPKNQIPNQEGHIKSQRNILQRGNSFTDFKHGGAEF